MGFAGLGAAGWAGGVLLELALDEEDLLELDLDDEAVLLDASMAARNCPSVGLSAGLWDGPRVFLG